MKNLIKDLMALVFKTYVINICSKHLFVYCNFKGFPLLTSKAAEDELTALGMTIENAKHILEEGFDC